MGATPPPYYPPRQQSSNKIWIWLLVGVAGLCVICGVGLFFLFKSGLNMGLGMVSCQANGDMARDAVIAYAMDHNGQFPSATNWQDEIKPYYERLYKKFAEDADMKDMPEMFKFDIAKPGEALSCDMGGGQVTGFAYNALLAGKLMTDFPDKAATVVIFEVLEPLYNANGNPSDRDSSATRPKIMGETRDWQDFFIEGQKEPMQSSNDGFDFETRPEDALPPGGGTSNPGGA